METWMDSAAYCRVHMSVQMPSCTQRVLDIIDHLESIDIKVGIELPQECVAVTYLALAFGKIFLNGYPEHTTHIAHNGGTRAQVSLILQIDPQTLYLISPILTACIRLPGSCC